MRSFMAVFVLASMITGPAAASSAVATGAVNVRTGPGTGYRIVDSLTKGEQVRVTECAANWCLVHRRGPDGWVSARYLSASPYRRQLHRQDPCDVDSSTAFHLRFGLYFTPLAEYCRERDD